MSQANWDLPSEPSTLTLLVTGIAIVGLYLLGSERYRFFWETRCERLRCEGLAGLSLLTRYEDRFRTSLDKLLTRLDLSKSQIVRPAIGTFRVPDVSPRLMSAVEIARLQLSQMLL